MLHRVFLSFHYSDLWRAQIVRNSGAAESLASGGFLDAASWESILRRGDAAIRAHIDQQLDGTSVTIVLIGAETANRAYVSYEIEQSIARGNGIFGIRIHTLKDARGATDSPGPIPKGLIRVHAPIYDWEFGQLQVWIEDAVKKAKEIRP